MGSFMLMSCKFWLKWFMVMFVFVLIKKDMGVFRMVFRSVRWNFFLDRGIILMIICLLLVSIYDKFDDSKDNILIVNGEINNGDIIKYGIKINLIF